MTAETRAAPEEVAISWCRSRLELTPAPLNLLFWWSHCTHSLFLVCWDHEQGRSPRRQMRCQTPPKLVSGAFLGEHLFVSSVLISTFYSCVGYGLQSGPTLAFSLWPTDFKTKTSFGFLIKKIRSRFCSYNFTKSKKMSSCDRKPCFWWS